MEAKQFLTFHLLSVPLLRRNTYLLYSLWLVVLILSYYKFAFEVIHVATSHYLNIIATGIVNLVVYILVGKTHSRHGDRKLFIIWAIVFLFTHMYECLHRYIVTDPTKSKISIKIEIAEQMCHTGIFGYIVIYSSGVFHELISENSKDSREKTNEIHTPIEIRDITLSNGTYPRIGKIQSWLRKKCDAISLTRAELDALRQTRNGHVVILRTGTSTDNYQICLSKQDIEQDERTSCVKTTSATQHLQLLLNRFVDNNVPFVVLCLLNTCERGNIMKQDKKIISHILKRCLSEFKNANVDIIYIVKSDTNVDLKDCSYDIQYKLNIKRETNTIYSRTFKAGEDDTVVKKRMGLYLERKLETSIVEVVKNTLLSENNSEVNHSTNKSVHSRKNGHVDHHHEYEEKDKSIFGEIICQLHHNSPDNCEMNELKVLLERTDDVRGYGVVDHKIKIYVEQEEQLLNVRSYLHKYFTENEGIVEFELWKRKGDILKCTLKQGEKVVRPDTKFGTLGMFLKDQSGNTYFTTCSHVTRMDEIARGDGGLELGQSVFAIDTATDMTYSDLIDLSIVKVKDDIASQCQFGLRTAADNNVVGQIVEEEVIQEINQELKVYKWGAKSQLTRGTYKGWIASKNQNRFDQNLHQIVNVSQKVFDEGDSGSLLCFEATGSPHLDSDSAGFIFVGKAYLPKPSQDEYENHWYYCYHVSKVFDQEGTNIDNLEACLDPNEPVNRISTGQMVQT